MLPQKNKYIFIFFLYLFVFSCGKRDSLTTFNDVYIYTSDIDKKMILETIENNLFDLKFYTPQEELRYIPIWKSPEEFLDKPLNPILMIISIKEYQDTTIDEISNIITSDIQQDNEIILINDYIAKNQCTLLLKETYPILNSIKPTLPKCSLL